MSDHITLDMGRPRPAGDPNTRMRIPVHAGTGFRSMPGQRSGRCRATIPEHAGIGGDAG